jgi:photosystem II stability/assembly factor-like uncharacterized protein
MRLIKILLLLLFITNIYNAQWINTSAPNNIIYYSLSIFDENIFACTDSGIFRATINDGNWIAINKGLTNSTVYSIGKNNNYLFACSNGGIFRSTNNGEQWLKSNTGLTDTTVMAIAVNGSNTYIGTFGGGVFYTSDNGLSWNEMNIGLINTKIRCLTVYNDKLYAATGDGVFVYSKSENKWTPSSEGMGTNNYSLTFATYNSKLFVGTHYSDGRTNSDYIPRDGGIYVLNSDEGKWDYLDNTLKNHTVNSFAVSDTNIIASTNFGGLFISTNMGVNWKSANTGLPESYNYSIAAKDNYLYVGTFNHGIWKRKIEELTTDVEESQEIPGIFKLVQNYPNPFNPVTTIGYQIPITAHVRVEVFDITGRHVITLVNKEELAGIYKVNFDASRLSSGIYFYKITTGSFNQTRKMILIK